MLIHIQKIQNFHWICCICIKPLIFIWAHLLVLFSTLICTCYPIFMLCWHFEAWIQKCVLTHPTSPIFFLFLTPSDICIPLSRDTVSTEPLGRDASWKSLRSQRERSSVCGQSHRRNWIERIGRTTRALQVCMQLQIKKTSSFEQRCVWS